MSVELSSVRGPLFDIGRYDLINSPLRPGLLSRRAGAAVRTVEARERHRASPGRRAVQPVDVPREATAKARSKVCLEVLQPNVRHRPDSHPHGEVRDPLRPRPEGGSRDGARQVTRVKPLGTDREQRAEDEERKVRAEQRCLLTVQRRDADLEEEANLALKARIAAARALLLRRASLRLRGHVVDERAYETDGARRGGDEGGESAVSVRRREGKGVGEYRTYETDGARRGGDERGESAVSVRRRGGKGVGQRSTHR